MSVLIKDMEIPKTEEESKLLILTPDGITCLTKLGTGNQKFDAIELPPHGRLIDADFIVKHLRKQIQDVGEDTELANRGREFISIIGAVSTIIPAEEGE